MQQCINQSECLTKFYIFIPNFPKVIRISIEIHQIHFICFSYFCTKFYLIISIIYIDFDGIDSNLKLSNLKFEGNRRCGSFLFQLYRHFRIRTLSSISTFISFIS